MDTGDWPSGLAVSTLGSSHTFSESEAQFHQQVKQQGLGQLKQAAQLWEPPPVGCGLASPGHPAVAVV